MPEGPEIFTLSKALQKIVGLKIVSSNYDLNDKIIKIFNKGKILIILLEKDKYIMIGFGLTGSIFLEDLKTKQTTQLVDYGANKIHERESFELYNAGNKIYRFIFSDSRKFGTIQMMTSKDFQKKMDSMAPDIMGISHQDLCKRLEKMRCSKRPKNIVRVFFDQKAVVCGLGNYMVCEVLYKTGISPHRDMRTLSDDDITSLAATIKNFYEKMAGLLLKGSKYEALDVFRKKKDRYNNPIIGDKFISGRTIWWVPAVQK